MRDLFLIVDATSRGNFSKLTRHRVPGALPFGGKYRLIDFTLSNCKNSGINNVAIFPYGNYRSLSDHIGSGDRWDLSRRHDGIFILPPKNQSITLENEISFQRMYEHIEYFYRSNQEYAIVTPANMVWNVDYYQFLEEHIKNEADLTEVLSDMRKVLKTYIISKKKLLEYIENYDQIAFRNLSDVFDYGPSLKKHTIVIDTFSYNISSANELYEANMQILLPWVRKQLFIETRPIYSKETMSAPSRYGDFAKVNNSIIASGAVIEGEVENSIIGRKVKIHYGAKVKDSIIMNQSIIESDAIVEYSIFDKETKVLKGSVVTGDENEIFVSEKKQIVTTHQKLAVLQLSSECYPYIKTGGLADVVGALAEEFSDMGIKSQVMLPLYPQIKEKYNLFLELKVSNSVKYDNKFYKVNLYSITNSNTVYYFVESYDFFERDKIYGYEDDGDRFAFFTVACVSFLDAIDEHPEIIHIHDWHLGLLPLVLKTRNIDIKTLMTIHNIEYQGIYDLNILEKLEIKNPINYTRLSKLNFMEIGLNNATKISTVSETYKDELRYEYYSKNLVEIINKRFRDFYGILNGLSKDINPAEDLEIAMKYNLVNVFTAKKINKLDLQRRLEINQGEHYLIIGMVTRIVEQKGFEIIIPALNQILENPEVEFVILGTGDEVYLDQLKALKARFLDRVSINLTYDATKPSYIYAGSDIFLMPSRYEPCGIGQMIALRYGTIPIVRQTGGLNDTVDNFDTSSKRGNGFKFFNYDTRDLLFQLNNAYNVFKNNSFDWNQLIINAMNSRFSLTDSAKKYLELYQMM
ncbi:MAG: glycogen/starch synthase [Candidatus Izemoplasmatales bacterium]|jgi:starch synthase|nr:glycogen/starch synthase [Candidatus Izemoplasmatales bacterium]